ncbi:hypothetical protein [Sphingobium chungbukense]|uniref:Uncharacterized protein n=1 Tax=Sphingobium chungbukense TaxID=56193 RepID=A0A0M3AR18_9SPHN|nr:hypothetical protein [Sphingobium chungbukense]KKW92280.1 hypothetical protein YP76_10135 [Sphingobium chungbukense]
MMILTRLDAWLGMNLFHPPIILLCQLTRQTQYAMYRALWFFACCHATYYAKDDGWGWAAFLWLWTIITFISAAFTPDVPTQSFGLFRFFVWSMLVIDLIGIASGGALHSLAIRNLIILFAEYAATIKAIPPRRKRERRTSAKEARA